MGKSFQKRTLLAFLPVAIIFIIGAILLNSCGQGNPAGSQTATTAASNPGAPNRNTPASTIPLAMTNPPSKVELSNASDTATIKWNSYPGATTYNLYYSNTPDFANSSKITGISSPYTFPLADRQKSYFFFLTAGNGTAERRISGDFISLYQNGDRYSVAISFDAIYKLFKGQQVASFSFPFMEKAYADILYWPSTVHADSSLTAYLNVSSPFNQILLDFQCLHKEPNGSYIYEEMVGVNNWNFPNNRGKRDNGVFIYSAKYNVDATGWWSVYLGTSTLGKFTDISTSITFKIDKPVTGHYTFVGRGVNILQDMAFNRIVTFPPGYLALNTGKEILRVNNSAVGGFWGEGFLLDFALVASGTAFTVTPASATAYLHPTPTAVQFTAKDGNNADVTNTARWIIEPTATTPPATIASINAGSATPLKPGEASVTAALLDGAGNVTASGQASLGVKCWDSKYWSQVDMNWRNHLYANHTIAETKVVHQWAAGLVKEGTIGFAGCTLTSVSMGIYSTGTYSQPDTLNDQMLNPPSTMPLPTYYTPDNRVVFFALRDFSNGAIKDVTSITRDNIKAELDKCNIVLANVANSSGCDHWVYVESYSGDNYTAYDPLRGTVTRTLTDFCGQVMVGRI